MKYIFIVVYILHKGRTSTPYAEDTILQLKKLLRTVRKSECVILVGDFNCQLRRNVPYAHTANVAAWLTYGIRITRYCTNK